VFRRVRPPALLVLPVVLVAALAGCGDEAASDEGLKGFDAVTISGDFGSAPEVEWKDKLIAGEVDTKVLVEGDGAEVADGDQLDVNVWIGNGFTEEQAYSTYTKDGKPETFTVNDQLTPVFRDALVGQTIGSRVAVTAPSSEVFGEAGNAQMGIGNEDGVLLVLDLMKMFEPPKPKDVAPSRLPGVVEEKGGPTSLDFKGLPKPQADGDLLRAVLKEGKGKPVTTDMTLTVDYLGMVYDAKTPFDESYSKQPAEFALTGVVQGWTYGLEGLKVGSRVVLQIPPALGYGAQEQAGIPANSTLYFVVDIISAK
jgi:peptidylprolyl isomerase